MKAKNRLALVISCLLLTTNACASTNEVAASEDGLNVGFIAFGDSGYHVDYLKKKQFVPKRSTKQDFIDYEYQDWLDDGKDPKYFVVPPMHYVAEVDSMVNASGMYPVAKAMKGYCQQNECQFSVMAGDNIYPDGATLGLDGKDDTTRFDDMFVKPFGDMGKDDPDYRIYTALGNHDWNTSREGAMAQVRFMETQKPFYMDGIFYTVKPPAGNGDIELFVIDTEVMLAAVEVKEAELNPDGSEKVHDEIDTPKEWTKPQTEAERNMVSWFESKLKNSTARWKLVLGHHPIWSSGGSKFEQARVLRELILPAMCKYADMYIAGHEHSLELHEDSCETVFGDGTEQPPLLQLLSGAAAKQRAVNVPFKSYQDKNYQQNNALWVKGMVWGYSHVQLVDDVATVKLITTPNDGSAKNNVEFTYQFNRRSGRVELSQ
ncbi:metallophosphoesterase [Lacimicrobium alkaliphilum]|uniref:Calcineurin-like phosphoesterase domain-containing protein n=1 Tax=Lacimicrobium alkaliphilum TaxID=1526571 RepID=A0A0U3AR21_9ALTE|nr:metallophosphoesterase [Lacimicrobium alkaliphilum]ALT00323.1 hypothetical protein AT746_04380 [Lacimicrobium alkaliphilum]